MLQNIRQLSFLLFLNSQSFVINLPQVVSANVIVQDSTGKEIESQILPVVDAAMALREFYATANVGKSPVGGPLYWLAFKVEVPPLGFSTYTVSSGKRAG